MSSEWQAILSHTNGQGNSKVNRSRKMSRYEDVHSLLCVYLTTVQSAEKYRQKKPLKWAHFSRSTMFNNSALAAFSTKHIIQFKHFYNNTSAISIITNRYLHWTQLGSFSITYSHFIVYFRQTSFYKTTNSAILQLICGSHKIVNGYFRSSNM